VRPVHRGAQPLLQRWRVEVDDVARVRLALLAAGVPVELDLVLDVVGAAAHRQP